MKTLTTSDDPQRFCLAGRGAADVTGGGFTALDNCRHDFNPPNL